MRRRTSRWPLVLLCGLSGCMHWTRDPDPPRIVATERITAARVVLSGGRVVTLEYPRVVGDSLIGTVPRGQLRDTVAVAVADVRQMDVQRLDGDRTVAFVVGAGLVVLLVVGLATIRIGY